MKAKHIEVRYHHIWELVPDKKLEVQKVDTDNITNSLTKPFLDHRVNKLRRQMGLLQVKEQRGAESEGAAGESKIRRG